MPLTRPMKSGTKKKSDPKLSEVARELVIPAGVVGTEWPRVRDTLKNLGIVFDMWQQGLARVALAKRADGSYAATVGGVVLSIPRQVGKTFFVGALVFALCLLRPGIRVVWTAHHLNTSDESFESMQAMAQMPKIAPHVLAVRTGNGKQRIRFRNKSQIEFGARESGFGRGKTKVSILVLDEFQHVSESALENLTPTMNQGDNPLLFAMGTPPRPIDKGEAFKNKRRRALAGGAKDTVYVEMSADPDADPDDRKQWAKANPSYPKRTNTDAMLRMRENLESDESFLREALGIWDEDAQAPALIRPSWWLATNVSELPEDGLPSFGVRFTADGTRVSLSGGLRTDDDEIGVELIESRSTYEGMDWIVKRLAKSKADLSMIVIDGKGDAATLYNLLREAKIPVTAINFRKDVLPSAMAAAAYSGFVDAVRSKQVVHTSDDYLTESVKWSKRRPIGNQGAYGFGPIRPGDDPSAVESAALAWYAAKFSKRKPSGRRKTAGSLVM